MNKLSSRTLLLGSAAAAAMLQAAPGHAQAEDQDGRDDILVIGTVQPLTIEASTGSRLGLTPLETPASISIVDGDAIRARGDLTIVEAASRAPGITQSANPGNGNMSLVSRGFGGPGSVLQLVDGIRLFPVAGTITFPTDPWNVERIEVLTGPASVLYGQGALGGAINVITKQPTDTQRFDVEASYGSQDTVHLAAGAGGPIGETLSYRVDASYRQSEGWVDRGDSDSIAIGASLRFAPTDTLSITFRFDYADVDPMEYWGTPLINGRLDDRNKRRNYNVGDADIDFRDDRQTLILEWAPTENITFTNTAYRLASKRSWYDLETYSYDPDTGLVDRFDNLGIVHDNEQLGNIATVAIRSPLGGQMSNNLVIGFDYNDIDLDYSNNFAFANQSDSVDPFDFDPGLMENRADTLPRYLTRTKEWSIFAEDRLELNEQFSIVGGFRYEEDRFKRRNFVYDANGNITGTVNVLPGGVPQKKFDDFTWRVGAVYQPTPNISLYGQYSTGVDPVGTLTTFTTNAVQFAFTNAKGDQIEAGVKASFLEGRGAATLSAYKIVKDDLTAQRTANGPLEQIGQQSSKGIEAALSLALAGGFGIEANGTILDADFDEFTTTGFDANGDPILLDYSGNTPPGVPEEAANLWLTWEGFKSVRAMAGLRYVGSRETNSANTLREVPSYVVVDAGLSYAFTENMAVDFRVYNLFDKDYVTSTYGPEQWLIGRPQSFDIAVRARF